MIVLYYVVSAAGIFLLLLGIYALAGRKRRTQLHLLINPVVAAACLYVNYSLLPLFSFRQFAIIITISYSAYLLVYLAQSDHGQGSNKPNGAKFKAYSGVKFPNGERIRNIFAGAYIGGAAGSGKTRAVIVPIMRHFGKHDFGGVVYAYKDFELVEYGLPVYGREKCVIFAPNSPEITVKINPLDPAYFQDESEIKNFYVEMLANLNKHKGGASKDNFFNTAAIGLLTGVTWIMKTEYPQFCTLPHVATLCIQNKFEALCRFLKTNDRAAIQAATYINSTGDQLSGVNGTVFNFLTSFTTPSICFALYDKAGNYESLKVNRRGDCKHLFLVNNIANEGVILPIINSITFLAMRLLTEGDIQHSYLLIDEGSTINLEGFSRKPATLRSYEIATIFSIQDHSLGIPFIIIAHKQPGVIRWQR